MAAAKQMPYKEQVMKEYEMLKTCCAGDPQKRPAFNDISTTEMDEHVNTGLNFAMHQSLLCMSMSFFFERDNVGLPGLALHCKTSSVDKQNLAFRFADFQNKRGAAAKVGSLDAPPVEFEGGKDMSDVTYMWMKMLAGQKTAYKIASDGYKMALKNGDAHAADFFANLSRYYSEDIRALSHELTHLKLVEKDKEAIKEFDREMEKKIMPRAVMAGIEATLPSRLVVGSGERLTCAVNSCINSDALKDSLGGPGTAVRRVME